mgnify:CR=1 FL=1
MHEKWTRIFHGNPGIMTGLSVMKLSFERYPGISGSIRFTQNPDFLKVRLNAYPCCNRYLAGDRLVCFENILVK